MKNEYEPGSYCRQHGVTRDVCGCQQIETDPVRVTLAMMDRAERVFSMPNQQSEGQR